MPRLAKPSIAVLGGTGKQGRGLALRWAHQGHSLIIGSRTAQRARETASKLQDLLDGKAVRGATNFEAAAAAEIVVLAVPFSAQQATVDEVAPALVGKILIDVTVPLVPPEVYRVQLPDGGSAVEKIQKKLEPMDVVVVSAFQNVSAHHLMELDSEVDCDVLVCSDDPAAADTVVELAEEIGLRAWNAGPLANSVVAEGLTSVLISLNRRYKVPAAGIRITGVLRGG